MNEQEFSNLVEPYISAGRPGNWEHTKEVVKWVKILGQNRPELNLIIRAAYIHDIGWKDLFNHSNKLSKDELKRVEVQANLNTEKYVREVLAKEGILSEEDIERVLQIIRAADLHKASNETEAVLVDADQLSKLNLWHLQNMYLPDEWMNMYNLWFEKYPERVTSQKAKELYPQLFETLKGDIDRELGTN
jgi:hypothetical protein